MSAATLLAGAWTVLSPAAMAADAPAEREEGFGLKVGQAFFRDNNVFRLPDGVRPPDGGPRSDRISRSNVGLSFEHTYSLQHVAAALDVVHRRYAEHDELDSTTKGGSLRWDWAVGKQWSGIALLQQREAPRNFDDTDRRVRSINTLQRAGFEARYWLHPDWSLLAGTERTRSRFSDSRSAASEYDETALEAGATYHPKSGNKLSFVARHAEGDYLRRPTPTSDHSSYTQRDLRLRGEWALTGISRLSGYAGYTDRDYSEISGLDFAGPTGRIVFDWAPTGKLGFQLVGRSEIGSEYEVIDNYVLTRGVELEARWTATSKITVRARAERLRRDYGDSPLSTIGSDRRQGYGLSVDYQALRTLLITASARRAKRFADGTAFDYTTNVYGLDLQLQF